MLSGIIRADPSNACVISKRIRYGEMVYQSNPSEFAPVAESAYCGAGVAHTMLLHTNAATGVLSVFPGLPSAGDSSSAWDNVTFHNLKAYGNLEVSAVRTAGATKWLAIRNANVDATVGVAFTVPRDTPWQNLAAHPHAVPRDVLVAPAQGSVSGRAVWNVTLEPGQRAALFVDPAVAAAGFVVQPLEPNASEFQWFGCVHARPGMHIA